MSNNIQPAEDLVGTTVMNPDGEDLGTVDQIMIDAEAGYVAYAILSFGGVLGFGDKQFAVPFSALEYDTEAGRFLMDVDRERLEEAPRLDDGERPEDEERFLEDIHVFYGVDPHWRHERDPDSVRSPSPPAAVPSS